MQKSHEIVEEFIETASCFSEWKDVKKVEKFILDMGINGEKPHEIPNHLSVHMGGIRAWVMPNQTSKYIAWLCSNGPFYSYLEIGTRYGGTFMITCEALRSTYGSLTALGCDVICKPVELSTYMKKRGFKYHHGSSLSGDFISKVESEKWSVCLIDGSHKYEEVMADYKNISSHCDVIVMHDICSDACPGVVRAWKEIKDMEKFNFYEFEDQYFSDKSYMGIGVIDKRNCL